MPNKWLLILLTNRFRIHLHRQPVLTIAFHPTIFHYLSVPNTNNNDCDPRWIEMESEDCRITIRWCAIFRWCRMGGLRDYWYRTNETTDAVRKKNHPNNVADIWHPIPRRRWHSLNIPHCRVPPFPLSAIAAWWRISGRAKTVHHSSVFCVRQLPPSPDLEAPAFVEEPFWWTKKGTQILWNRTENRKRYKCNEIMHLHLRLFFTDFTFVETSLIIESGCRYLSAHSWMERVQFERWFHQFN